MRRCVALIKRVRSRVHSSRLRLYVVRLSVGNNTIQNMYIRHRRILKLRQELYEGLPQRRHDVCWIVHSQASDQCNGSDPVLKHFVVHSDE